MIIEGKRIKENIVYKKVYSVWKNMYDRCYKTTCSCYKNYGLKGITVCERWHTLDNFIEDIDKIDGFDFKLFVNGYLSLDKDSKVKNNYKKLIKSIDILLIKDLILYISNLRR